MQPSLGTYYPWQFSGFRPEKIRLRIFGLTPGVKVFTPSGSTAIMLLVEKRQVNLKIGDEQIQTTHDFGFLCRRVNGNTGIGTDQEGVWLIQFDPGYLTFSYPPELINLYSRWKDLEEEKQLQLGAEDFRYCQHLMQGFIYLEGIRSDHPEYYYQKHLDLLIVKVHESSDAVHRYSEEKQRTKSLMFDYLGLVRMHYRDNWSMEQYARELLVSKDYLHQLCSRHLGKTPSEVIFDKQAIEAQILLKNTSLTIKEIAHRLNFEDQNYFTRFFTRKVGLAPTEFRNKVKIMHSSSDLDHPA